jgi:P27 family predicted phage terminase small subunit
MSRGTRPTPTTLKVLRGNPGRRPLNRDEPQYEAGIPDKPEWFGTYASEEWDRITGNLNRQRILTKADLGILVATCVCYEQMRETLAIIQTLGRTYVVEDMNGNRHFKTRPECMRFENAQREYRALLIELGLTPASRGKVRVLPEIEQPSGTGIYFT